MYKKKKNLTDHDPLSSQISFMVPGVYEDCIFVRRQGSVYPKSVTFPSSKI